MKRRLTAVLLMLGLLFIMIGCNSSQTPDIETKPTNTTAPTSAEEQLIISVTYEYRTFEEHLAWATNIVVATYTGKIERHGTCYDLAFSPVEQLKGSGITEDFHIRAFAHEAHGGPSYYITDDDITGRYVVGKKYVLVLEKYFSVYHPYDIYVLLGNIFIEEGKKPTIYGYNTSLSQHSETQATIENMESAIKYINEFLQKGVDYSGEINEIYDNLFIRSNNLTEVVAQTPIIAEVVPVEFDKTVENNNTEWYLCEVQNVLKGNIPDKTIKIIYTAGTVEIGSKYTVMLMDPGSTPYYRLSSKISAHSSNSETAEQIKALVKDSSLTK